MDPKPLSWVLTAVRGSAEAEPDRLPRVEIRGVSTDSREVKEGDLFVALAGDRFDGHRYVGEAFRRGAAAAIISEDVRDIGGFRDRPVVRVADTREALRRLAREYRRTLKAEIVAITGSNGKTTVKDLVAHLLEPVGPVVKAQKSYNNDIGLPLTILSMDSGTRFGVLEMGTNRPGEIAALCRIAQPHVGVVTNVGHAHLEGLGGILGVAEEKGALVEALPAGGMAFLNHEDFHCREMARRAPCPIVRFGFDPSADLWGLRRTRTREGMSFFLYGKMEVVLSVPGLHNSMNALAAIGVALRAGVSPTVMVERLREFRLPEMRLTRREVEGVTFVNDAYNANPTSVAAAVDELRAHPASGRRILILGDMCELGDQAAMLHRQTGRRAARAGIHTVWAVGRHAAKVGEGVAAVARFTGEFHRSTCTDDALASPAVVPMPGDVVMVKGSRRMRLERLHDLLITQVSGERVATQV